MKTALRDGMKRNTGSYKKLGAIQYFVPYPLPPDPPLEITQEIATALSAAAYNLSRLNEMAYRLPNKERFIKAYVIKEALLSSSIEGIHTTIIDVFTQPLLDPKVDKETQLVLNYTKALDVATHMIQQEKLPITNRVLVRAHEELMRGQGDAAHPGNYRKQMVQVGNLIPPSPQDIPLLMKDLEEYINTPQILPELIQAGLAHVQFETIHPFLDGNGRIGRLLIVLMLLKNDLLYAPILYPSYYFKKYHTTYYQRLDAVRTDGDFEGWILFYLKGIEESSTDAYMRAQKIIELQVSLEKHIDTDQRFIKMRDTAHEALALLFQFPVIDITSLSEKIDKSYNAAKQLIERFVALGILTETTGQQRNRLYQFTAYLELLEKDIPH